MWIFRKVASNSCSHKPPRGGKVRYRQQLLEDRRYTLTKYWKSFACLQDNRAVDLIMEDGRQLYRTVYTTMEKISWEDFAKRVLSLASAVRNPNVHLNVLGEAATRAQSVKELQLISLLMLPFLERAGTIPKKDTTAYSSTCRPTQTHVATQFVHHFNTVSEADEFYEGFSQCVERGSVEGLHPLVAIVGPFSSPFCQILMKDKKYIVDDWQKEIMFAIAIYISTHTIYPPYARTLWTIIQRHGIKAQTEWDQINTLVYERLEQRLLDARPCPIYASIEAGAEDISPDENDSSDDPTYTGESEDNAMEESEISGETEEDSEESEEDAYGNAEKDEEMYTSNVDIQLE